ncbi:lysozyme inhibitor LprI family protein [Burkholderia ubonensis]|uniref:lysozyme inhibitor LprI family protein n=1 Tax=Burkholderia ubonensis TaxID=101571 RepID=UPI0009B49556|nr:lysozyme inhibitor LprI family protein [Burkholderia ubonensis]
MRTIVLTTFATAASLPPDSFAAPNSVIPSERELRAECSYEITGVKECLQKKRQDSEANLKHAEDKAENLFDRWDEDPKYIRITKARFVASKKAFAKYREAQCAFASSLGGGAIGNALEMQRLACVAELNNRRADQLRDAVSGLPLK